MRNIHFNNSSNSRQRTIDFAMAILTEILQNKERVFQISIDDGDGDVWKYTISVDCDQLEGVLYITEN